LKHNNSDFNIVAIYGGTPYEAQTRMLSSGVDVIVATPGRLMDLMEKRVVNFEELQATCIDEADQMLEKGFKLDIEQIFSAIKSQNDKKTQNLMFSATIP
jgi:superfamily II DNA/RNA helicase